MRRYLRILLITIWGIVSCTRMEMPHSSLRIVFETGSMGTKADTPTAANGDLIVLSGSGTNESPYRPDLVILVAETTGSRDIVGRFDGLAATNQNSSLEGTPTSAQMSVSFSGLTNSATYTVYAFANTQGYWTMHNGQAISRSDLTDNSKIATATDIEGLKFQPDPDEGDLDAYNCMAVKESRLPLSATGSVTLSSGGNGEISLQLLRCVAKVTARFENQYGSDLKLYEFSNSFVNMRPASGYVIPRSGVEDFAEVPLNTIDDDLIASETDPLSILNGGVVEKSWYVFPSIGPYTCDVSFYLASRTDNQDPTYNPAAEIHSFSDLQVHDDHARDISQLARNQHLTITTRIGKGKSVSFNFEVSDWDGKTETITFN